MFLYNCGSVFVVILKQVQTMRIKNAIILTVPALCLGSMDTPFDLELKWISNCLALVSGYSVTISRGHILLQSNLCILHGASGSTCKHSVILGNVNKLQILLEGWQSLRYSQRLHGTRNSGGGD